MHPVGEHNDNEHMRISGARTDSMYNKATKQQNHTDNTKTDRGYTLAVSRAGVHGAALAPRAGGEARPPARSPRRALIHRNFDIPIYRHTDKSIYQHIDKLIIYILRYIDISILRYIANLIFRCANMFDISHARYFSARMRDTHLTLRWRRRGTPGRGCGKECQPYRSPDGRPSPQPPHAQRTCGVKRWRNNQ